MTTPNTPNSNVPPVPQPPKKGLSPLAWIGIGCLGLLIVGGIVATIITVFVARKVSEVASEMQEDPVAATAKLLAAANPDIELVAADKENRTVTFREVSTGKELTFGYDDIEQGRVSFSSGEETAEVSVTGQEGAGELTVKTSEGTATFGAGESAGDIPDWIPVYPDAPITNNFSSELQGQRSGTFSFTTDSDIDTILNYYDTEAKALGLDTKSRTATPDGAIWLGSSSDESRSLTLMVSKATSGSGGNEVAVSFTEKR
jgi:hypothetical protein